MYQHTKSVCASGFTPELQRIIQMNRRKIAIGAFILFSLLLIAGVVLAAPNAIMIDRWVIGGGGARLVNAPLSLEGTTGQPLVGILTESPHELSSGFWFEIHIGENGVYLPLMLRE